ncbi:DedA family protein [Nakamurella aerolata]|uniref:DedA family protein n=1 Tax=Nakamurella aerolata TaxID=1656892 RepID=A0A849A1I6_9ACTN|nr:DedA family protein [Nakamurella aerolata]NNG34435.1 DedA family protein [Nakamurella aerolata]
MAGACGTWDAGSPACGSEPTWPRTARRSSFDSTAFEDRPGSVAGAVIVYALGALLGRDRVRRLADRIPLVKVTDVDRAETWFSRHGGKAVLFGRMVPLVRSFISLPAGVERMNLLRFLILTTLGSLAWNAIFVTAGYQLGQNWHLVERYTDVLQKVVIVAIVAAVTLFIVVRLRQHRNTEPAG